MLYFSSHNLGLFLSSMQLLSGAAKLFSVNTLMPRLLLFTEEDADLKRSCSFKVSIEQLSFSIQLAAQIHALFLHLTAICLFLFILSLFFYRKLMLHFILCRLCLHNTSQIAFRTDCTHRYAPTLKPQTHVCHLDGPCIIYLVHLDDEIR